MNWSVYKCNSTDRARTDVRGDWAKSLEWWRVECFWEETKWLKDLKQLKADDRVRGHHQIDVKSFGYWRSPA